MALTKGNYTGGQMPQGLTDEQQREQTRAIIILQMRRCLRFFWIGLTILVIAYAAVMGKEGIVSSVIGGIVAGFIGYGLTVWFFIYLISSTAIKIFLYLNSLFRGNARL